MDNRLFKKCYVDYKQLERHLYNNIGYDSSIHVAYNFIEKLDVDNGTLEASGTIDQIKYSGSEGIIKRIFK